MIAKEKVSSVRLFNLRTENIDDEVKVSVTVESEALGIKELWFSTPKKYSANITDDRYDAFLVGMLLIAMKYGENIYVDGIVSNKLLFNINNHLVHLLNNFSPSYKVIEVTAASVTSVKYDGKGVGTGFSGGIDSFFTIYKHYELEKNQEYRINSLLFLNVGALGYFNEERVRERFFQRYNYLNRCAEEIGLDFIPVDSNIFIFYPKIFGTMHTLITASGILFMQKLYSKYYYASAGRPYRDVYKHYKLYLGKDISMFDPILLSLLSTESIELILDAIQYTRVEKTLQLVNYQPVYKYLNVCLHNGDTYENCSTCKKCLRTMMTLDLIGKLKDFDQVFDIKKYKLKSGREYIYEQVLLQNKEPYAKYNIQLAKENNVRLPSKVWCSIACFPAFLKNQFIALAKPILPDTIRQNIRQSIAYNKRE